MSRFEIRQGRTKLGRRRWRVVLIGDNNRVLSVSETLNTLAAAYTNVDAQRGAVDAPVIEK